MHTVNGSTHALYYVRFPFPCQNGSEHISDHKLIVWHLFSVFALSLPTRGRLQLILQLSLLLSQGHQCISDSVSLLFQLLFFFQVPLGILLSARFPIPPILVGV